MFKFFKPSVGQKIKLQSLAVFVCSWLWLGGAYGAEPPAKFLFAYRAIGGNAMPLWIAKEQGIFRKYNLPSSTALAKFSTSWGLARKYLREATKPDD